MQIFITITNFAFAFTLGFYFICVLQWFSYRLKRVIFHFTKPAWHIKFFVIPLVVYYIFFIINPYIFALFFWIILFPMMILWYKKLDKKLVFTARVKRFFLILLLTIAGINFVLNFSFDLAAFFIFTPLVLAFFISDCVEKIIFLYYKNRAFKKISNFSNLLIIQITASYGKTSIKNFLYEILSAKFSCHKTERSVNTLGGIILDINENLNENVQIYIAESGARNIGDIDEITQFLRPQIVIVGEIGAMHIEYFKNIENIRKTKLEALNSPRLQKAFLHSSTKLINSDKIVIYDDLISDEKANLQGISFAIHMGEEKVKFNSTILGKFNTQNIAVCVLVARFLAVETDKISQKVANLTNVDHRLKRMDVGGKIIIDDGFNGNLRGMISSYELVSGFSGRKVLVTPGIIESNEEQNINLAKFANQIFDLIIVTGAINREIFVNFVDEIKLIICDDKAKLVEILAKYTQNGDLILFSNDAPSYI